MNTPDPTIHDAAHAVRLAVRWHKPLLAVVGTVLLGAAAAGGWQMRNAQKIAQVDALGEKVAEHDRQLQGIKQDVAVMRLDMSVVRSDLARAEAADQKSKEEVLAEVRELRADIRALYNPRPLPLTEEPNGPDRDRRPRSASPGIAPACP